MPDGGKGDLPRLTTAQVAARLGVKQETVYAYVSRGFLSRARGERNGGSTFDPLEVEALALHARRRRTGQHGPGTPTGTPLMVLDSCLTLIQDDQLFFRGIDAVDLCTRISFERAAIFMWTGTLIDDVAFRADQASVELLAESDGWRIRLSAMDRLRLGVAVGGSGNPTRYQTDQRAVVQSASSLMPLLVRSLSAGTHSGPPPHDASLAAALWSALSTRRCGAGDLRVLNAALVLLLDHDLAMSTLAARVAASARAHPYAVVAAGLAALDGTLHGAASQAAAELLGAVLVRGRRPADAVADFLRAGQPLPGFGHVIYRHQDPRAAVLLDFMEEIPAYGPAVAVARDLIALIVNRTGLPANVDLALGVLSIGGGMPVDAGEAIFAVSRTAGWIAHALEEYLAPAARLRPTARYTGPEAQTL